MPSLLELCEKYFETRDLYQVLGFGSKEEASDPDKIKKAYYRVSLKVHPDRVTAEEKDKATVKFQTLGKVYSILSDKDAKACYDETGDIDEENSLPKVQDWDQYWRSMFKKVSVEDINDFEKNYKESDEELNDLKKAYIEGEGCMEFILTQVLCCTVDDEPRFKKIIKKWIDEDDVPAFEKFTKETKEKSTVRKRKAAKEAEEAEKHKKELGLDNSEESLKKLILGNAKQRAQASDNFLDSLASKYGSGGTGGKKGRKSKK
ncbi:dnaJ homolog subfamily C member 9 [Oratosquilla oratoria]|uniref:dnaJ homolog subfamily C member 9 n=1 Tax=Oratosquilla oratoria TaxID=337810 RepID=UPI003F763D9C